jgi:hypothetical protein
MTSFVFYRMVSQSLAPLRVGTAEGAIATEGWQDKSDSLRPCPAVVLSLLVSMFAQAANSPRSLTGSESRCPDASIFTSSIGAHVR